MTADAITTGKRTAAREQHRRTVRRQIADAALDLFERQGIDNTTVDEIAQSARVSARTFYRYAHTKENAVFIDDTTMEILLERVDSVEHSMPAVIAAIEHEQLHILDSIDRGTPEEHTRLLRLRRLVGTEPALLSKTLMREENQVQDLTALVLRAGRTTDLAEIQARTIVTAIGTAIRLSFDEWARHAERGHKTTTRAHYEQIRAGLTAYFSGERHGEEPARSLAGPGASGDRR